MTRNKKQDAAQQKHLVQPGELDTQMSLPEMIESRRNRYLLVNVLARRGRELNRGERAAVELAQPYSQTQLAMAEAVAGKLNLERKAISKVLVNLIDNE